MNIILDSNGVRDGAEINYTRLSFAVERSKNLNATLVIPNPVIIELHSFLKERITQIISKFQSAQKSLFNIDPSAQEYRPSQESIHRGQIERLEKFVEDSRITVLNFPQAVPNLRELFQLAADKKPPFDPEGKSYRDAIIWYCIKEFLDAHSKTQTLFFTGDDDFRTSVAQLSKGYKFATHDIKELHEVLNGFLSGAEQARYSKIRDTAALILRTDRFGELSERLQGMPFTPPPFFLGSIDKIEKIEPMADVQIKDLSIQKNLVSFFAVFSGVWTLFGNVIDPSSAARFQFTTTATGFAAGFERATGKLIRPPSIFTRSQFQVADVFEVACNGTLGSNDEIISLELGTSRRLENYVPTVLPPQPSGQEGLKE